MNRPRAIVSSVVLAVVLAAPILAVAQSLDAQKAIIAARYPRVRWVTTSTLSRWMGRSGNGGPVLLDAREAEEYAVSHIRGARRVDPDLSDVGSLEVDQGQRVVVYCSVGWRSGAVADRLRAAGYRQVYNLEGGIFRWANEGRTLYRARRVVRAVHPYDATWGRMLEPEHRAR